MQAPVRGAAGTDRRLLLFGALAAAGVLAAVALGPAAPAPFIVACGLAGLAGIAAIATRVSPAWMVSLGIVAAPMAGNWGFVGIPGALAPDRFLLLAGVVAALARVPALRGLPEPRVRAAHWFFAAYLAYGIGSALIVGTLLIDTVYQVERLGLTALGCFLVAPVVFARRQDRLILLWSLTGLGAYLGLLAIVEIVAPALAFPPFVADASVARNLGRARGPFLESGLNGFAMFTSALAAAVLYVTAPGPWVRRVAPAVVLLCALGILLTLTRTVWLGSAAGVVAALALTPRLRHLLVPALVAGAVLVLIAFAFIPGLAGSATDRAGNQQTIWDRQNLNRAAVGMLLDQPLVGQGWSRFSAVANDFFWQADGYPIGVSRAKTGAHNLPLAIASELGLIGIALWTAGMIAALWAAFTGPIPREVEPWRVAFIALAVHVAVMIMVTPAHHPFVLLITLVWAAIAAGPNSLQPGSGRVP
jgi:O-antigen ligase